MLHKHAHVCVYSYVRMVEQLCLQFSQVPQHEFSFCQPWLILLYSNQLKCIRHMANFVLCEDINIMKMNCQLSVCVLR